MKVTTKLVGQEVLWCLWDGNVDEKGMGDIALNSEGAPKLFLSREAAEAEPFREGWIPIQVRITVEEMIWTSKERKWKLS